MARDSLDPLHWDDLRKHQREAVLSHEGVETASSGPGFEVRFLNARYLVSPLTETIMEISPNPDRVLSAALQILLIRYLVSPYVGPLDGIEVSEKDLPGGVQFFQGPHALNMDPIITRFGKDADGFESLGKRFRAKAVGHGDKAMRFLPFQRVPVTYVLWMEDEEFPASVSVLFDKSISRRFALDMVFALVQVLTQRIFED
jgi:hypothetical protein